MKLPNVMKFRVNSYTLPVYFIHRSVGLHIRLSQVIKKGINALQKRCDQKKAVTTF